MIDTIVKKYTMVKGGVFMKQVSVLEAKTNLSYLLSLIESGKEEHVIIARYGKPIAKIVTYNQSPASKRIGIARGKLKSPEDLDRYNNEIENLFEGGL